MIRFTDVNSRMSLECDRTVEVVNSYLKKDKKISDQLSMSKYNRH